MENRLKHKFKNSLYAFIVLLFVTQGCSNNDTSPTQPQPLKDPRTYTWTADTLTYPGSAQTLMNSIWGSSPKDVYAVGHNDRGGGKMFHFNGQRWSTDDIVIGSPLGPIDLSSVYGFSANDIYAVGEHLKLSTNLPQKLIITSLIIHYDGSTWTEVNLPSVGGLLNTVYGTNSNNVWAGGENALYHYDGSKWTRDSVLVSVSNNGVFQFISFSTYNSIVYAVGITEHNNGISEDHLLFKEINNNLTIIDSAINTFQGPFGTRLWSSPQGKLYSAGIGISIYNGLLWSNILQTPSYIRSIYGTSDNNIFAVGDRGQAYHFNGTDWQNIAPKLSKDTRTLYTGVWTDGTEAFIIEQPQTGFPAKTVIWHGK